MSIKQKTFTGSLWNIGRTMSVNIVDFIVYAILARVLTLEDFGLLIFCLLIVELANVFINVGINQNLIQREKWEDNFASSTFVFIAGLSFSISLFVGVVGVPSAYYFHSSEASYILLGLCIIPLLVGLQSVFSAKLEREFKNKNITFIRASASFLSGIVTIILALTGAGIWSLVIGKVLQHSITLLLLIFHAHFKPKFLLEKAHIKELFDFSLPLVWVAILNFLNNKATNLYTGAILGTETFALISVAKKGQEVLSQTTITPINKMVVPAISRVKIENRLSAFYRLLKSTSIIVIPAFLGLGAVSGQFIELAFGPKFSQSADLLFITSTIIIASILSWYLPNMLISAGATKAALKLNLVQFFNTVIVSGGTIWFGVETMLICVVLSSYLTVPIRIHITKQYYDVSLYTMIKQILPASISSIIMMIAIRIADDFIEVSDKVYIDLIFLVFVGLLSYALAFFLLFFRQFKDSFKELKSLIKRK